MDLARRSTRWWWGAVVLTACAVPDADPITHPTGPDELVLRWEHRGGYRQPMPWEPYQAMPEWSLYGNGLVLMPPHRGSSVWPAIRAVRLTEEQVQRILRAARDARLLEPGVSFDFFGVTDAGTDVITLAADGKRGTVTAYALDVEVPPRPGFRSSVEWRARRQLRDLGRMIRDLSVSPEAVPVTYDPQALAVVVLPYAVVDHSLAPGGQDDRLTVAWPLATPVSSAPQCFVVRGAAIAALRRVAEQATKTTPWTSDGSEYLVVLRPLLPDEPTIPRLAGLGCDSVPAGPPVTRRVDQAGSTSGVLRVAVAPAAELFLDGQSRGAGVRFQDTLPVGPARIRLVPTDRAYRDSGFVVDVVPGVSVRRIQLQRR